MGSARIGDTPQHAGDGHALLLPAREVVGQVGGREDARPAQSLIDARLASERDLRSPRDVACRDVQVRSG